MSERDGCAGVSGRAAQGHGVTSGQPLLHLAITTRLKLLWTFDKCWEIAASRYFMMLIKCLRWLRYFTILLTLLTGTVARDFGLRSLTHKHMYVL